MAKKAKPKIKATKLIVGLPFGLGQMEFEPEEETALPVTLRVAILDADDTSSRVLQALIGMKLGIEKVKTFSEPDIAKQAFRNEDFNCLFIDIFSFDAKMGVEFIEYVRREYPEVSICLYSQSPLLLTMPDVSDEWRNRFGHYFKLSKDQP